MARRSTLLCLIPFAAVIATAFMPGGVVIEGAVAENPGVGDQTTFQVSIQKGGLDYFGRILIQAPPDCQLTPSSLFGGSFDWDDDTHIAVVSWLKLPEPDRFDIEFNLLVDPNAVAGPRELDLEFSFIQNNDRATVTPPPVVFEVQGRSGTNTTPPTVSGGVSAPGAEALVTRSITAKGVSAEVRIALQNIPEGGFVKLAEQIPSGCEFRMLSAGGGVVQMEGKGLSVLWFDYAKAGDVVYQISGCPLSSLENITGSLSYVQDDVPVEIPLIDVIQGEMSQPTMETDGASVRFEVQVAATKKAVVTDYFERRLNFRLGTREERLDGWVKYTHGNFERYEEARNHRNDLTSAYDFKGPFVVGRLGQRRISVQEALTRTNQIWVP